MPSVHQKIDLLFRVDAHFSRRLYSAPLDTTRYVKIITSNTLSYSDSSCRIHRLQVSSQPKPPHQRLLHTPHFHLAHHHQQVAPHPSNLHLPHQASHLRRAPEVTITPAMEQAKDREDSQASQASSHALSLRTVSPSVLIVQ